MRTFSNTQNIKHIQFRKDTNCERLIPADSFHDHRHKMAVFHSMVHKLISIKMTTINYENEPSLGTN